MERRDFLKAATVVVAATFASFIPARRATQTDPLVVLRSE
jgi:ABC-type lipoprotein release transport system permease subunit